MLNRAALFLLTSMLIVSFSFDAHALLYTDRETRSGADIYLAAPKYYDPYIGRFIARDPIRDGINWYAYANNNPLKYIDPNGLQPVQKAAASADEFVDHLRNGRKEKKLSNYFTGYADSQETTPFTNEEPRYVATDNYGWLDMQHFLAAAAMAAHYLSLEPIPEHAHEQAYNSGEWVEKMQFITSSQSAYSYEDLPSNDAGATFGAHHYDPNGAPLADQVGDFLTNQAGAQGEKSRNTDGTWGDWTTKPNTFDHLPETAKGAPYPPQNFSRTPFSDEKLIRELKKRKQ